MDIRSKSATREFRKTWFIILACAIGLQPSNRAWNTSPHWIRLSTSLNLEVAPTLPQLQKLQLGRWTPKKVVQVAQLAWPKTTVWPAQTVARWVISLPIAQTATWWRRYLNKLWSAKMPQKPTLDAPVKIRNREVHQLVERRVGGLQRKRKLIRWRTVRWRASWIVSWTRTLKWEKAKKVSSCRCTSNKNTIMYGIVKQKGWQIGSR